MIIGGGGYLIFIHWAGWEGAGARTTGTRHCVRIGVVPDAPINKVTEQDVHLNLHPSTYAVFMRTRRKLNK